jgi:hypothetical protein
MAARRPTTATAQSDAPTTNASRPQSAPYTRPQSALQQRASDRRRARVSDGGSRQSPAPPLIWTPADSEQADSVELTPLEHYMAVALADLQSRPPVQPRSPSSRGVSPRVWTWNQGHESDFRSSACYQRLVRRYGRSHGALGNFSEGEQARELDTRANVHCPACLLEEQGTRRELERVRRELEREKARSRAALKKQAEEYEAKLHASRILLEQEQAKVKERDAEISALRAELAALRQQLLELQGVCADLQDRLRRAEERERAAIEGQRRLLDELEILKALHLAAAKETSPAAQHTFDAAEVLRILKDFLRSGDAQRRGYIMQGILGMYDMQQCHAILSTVLRYIGSELNVKLFDNPAVPVNNHQIEHLLQWLLRLKGWSAEDILRGLSMEEDVRTLLVKLLQMAEATKGCTTGSVLERLLSEASISIIAVQLELDPLELLQKTFGVSRRVPVQTVATASQTDEPQKEQEEEEIKPTKIRRKQAKRENVTSMPIRVARRAVAKIFQKKAIADFVDDKAGHRRDELPEFIAEYFVHEYGLASLANTESAKLTASVLQYAKAEGLTEKEDASFSLVPTQSQRYDRRLRLFGHLCGMLSANLSLDNQEVGYHPSDSNIVMDLLAHLYGSDHSNKLVDSAGLQHIAEKYGTDQPSLPQSRCKAAIQAVWTARRVTVPLELTEIIQSITVPKTGHQLEDMVDVDALLEQVWMHWSVRRSAPMAKLYTLFSQFDDDNNGVLNYDEFVRLVSRLAADEGFKRPPEHELTRMYREAVEDTRESTGGTVAEDAISVPMFVAVAQRHMMVNVMPDPVEDGKDPRRSVTGAFGSSKSWKVLQSAQTLAQRDQLEQQASPVIRRVKRGTSMSGIKVRDIRGTAEISRTASSQTVASPPAADNRFALVPAS